jgi:hypothetical protein
VGANTTHPKYQEGNGEPDEEQKLAQHSNRQKPARLTTAIYICYSTHIQATQRSDHIPKAPIHLTPHHTDVHACNSRPTQNTQ